MCLTHHLWEDLSAQIHKFLSDITLADLVSKREIEAIARNQSKRVNRGAESTDRAGKEEISEKTGNTLERIAASSL